LLSKIHFTATLASTTHAFTVPDLHGSSLPSKGMEREQWGVRSAIFAVVEATLAGGEVHIA